MVTSAFSSSNVPLPEDVHCHAVAMALEVPVKETAALFAQTLCPK